MRSQVFVVFQTLRNQISNVFECSTCKHHQVVNNRALNEKKWKNASKRVKRHRKLRKITYFEVKKSQITGKTMKKF